MNVSKEVHSLISVKEEFLSLIAAAMDYIEGFEQLLNSFSVFFDKVDEQVNNTSAALVEEEDAGLV